MLTILHVQNVLIILNWCLCDFLLLKHIDEVHALHLHLSFTDVDIFFVWKIFYNFNIAFHYLLMLTIFHVKMFLSFSTDVYVIFLYWNILMKCTHFIFICHILLLIIYWCWLFFHVQIVLIILNWCLCDFLVLKHINEVDALHLHLSFTDVDMFQYCFWLFTDVDYCLCAKCSYHSPLMFMWFSCTETYWWSGCTSSSFVIDIFFVWKIFYNFNTAFDYLLMLTIFSCAKCSYHSQLMFMWFSVTETYWWSARISSSFVIYWCWHIFCVENILQFQYCFWLFIDVDYFFMCKMFLSFSPDVYVIFCYWNILMKCMHFIFICHLLMLTYFLCGKYSTISILLLIIYWC